MVEKTNLSNEMIKIHLNCPKNLPSFMDMNYVARERHLAVNSFIVRCHVTTNYPMNGRAVAGKTAAYQVNPFISNIACAEHSPFLFPHITGLSRKRRERLNLSTKFMLSDHILYYPTALCRVQITPKTSTNITRYLSSRGPV